MSKTGMSFSSQEEGHKRKGISQIAAFKSFILALTIPRSKDQLVEVTGMTAYTVRKWLKVLHQKPKCVHIDSYCRQRPGIPAALWIWGTGEDALYPARLTEQERGRRARANKQRREDALARNRELLPSRNSVVSIFQLGESQCPTKP